MAFDGNDKKAIRVLVTGTFSTQKKNMIETLRNMEGISTVKYLTSGEEAINIHRAFNPDIIFVDVVMCGMTGFETARWIKEQNRKIKVVILSTQINQEFMIAVVKMGLDGYLPTHADRNALEETLSTILKGKSYLMMNG